MSTSCVCVHACSCRGVCSLRCVHPCRCMWGRFTQVCAMHIHTGVGIQAGVCLHTCACSCRCVCTWVCVHPDRRVCSCKCVCVFMQMCAIHVQSLHSSTWCRARRSLGGVKEGAASPGDSTGLRGNTGHTSQAHRTGCRTACRPEQNSPEREVMNFPFPGKA